MPPEWHARSDPAGVHSRARWVSVGSWIRRARHWRGRGAGGESELGRVGGNEWVTSDLSRPSEGTPGGTLCGRSDGRAEAQLCPRPNTCVTTTHPTSPRREISGWAARTLQPTGPCATRPSLIPLLPLRMLQVTHQLAEPQIQSARRDPDVTPAQRHRGVEPTPDVARGTSKTQYNQQTDHVVSSCCS